MFKIFLFTFFISISAQAQKVETIVKEIQTPSDRKALAQKKALNEVSRKVVLEMLGEDKYEKEMQKIERSIIKKRNRYILSIRSTQPVLQEDGGFSSTVTIKFSKENLKKLLLEHNLFYASEGSFCLLPVVSFSSHFEDKRKEWSWWLKNQDKESEALLSDMGTPFFELLKKELIKKGFYTIDPAFQKVSEGVPSGVLPKNSSRAKNFIPLAEFYTCDIILLGYVHLGRSLNKSSSTLSQLFSSSSTKTADFSVDSEQYFTNFSFNVFNIKTQQFLFKLKKQFPYPPAMKNSPEKELLLRFKDVLDSLTYQLSFYQEEGSLDLNRLLISVQGPLNYAQKERLKKSLIQNVSGIQNLEERLLTSSRVVYEAEVSKDIKAIAKQLRKLSLKAFVIQLKGYKKQELEIYAKQRL